MVGRAADVAQRARRDPLRRARTMPFGFVKDDVNVISAFADQATVAIENSRLIKSSIERERLMREMLLAQEMQRKLLPQSLPSLPTLEIDAVSTPAFEVGGDYYDFMELRPTAGRHRRGRRLGQGRLGRVLHVGGEGDLPGARPHVLVAAGIHGARQRVAGRVLLTNIPLLAYFTRFWTSHPASSRSPARDIARCCMSRGERRAYVRPGGMGIGLSGDSDLRRRDRRGDGDRLSAGGRLRPLHGLA